MKPLAGHRHTLDKGFGVVSSNSIIRPFAGMDKLPKLTLVLGGARSGKSTYAEHLVMASPPPWIYCATGQAFDAEMTTRIAAHQARRNANWRTVDVPLELPEVLLGCPTGQTVLIDCLTLWTSNLMLAERDISVATADLMAALQSTAGPVVAVSNEVGLGIVPENALARRFRDEAGRMNQKIAALADRVVFIVAGLPLALKG